jgi:hypothetical protein
VDWLDLTSGIPEHMFKGYGSAIRSKERNLAFAYSLIKGMKYSETLATLGPNFPDICDEAMRTLAAQMSSETRSWMVK